MVLVLDGILEKEWKRSNSGSHCERTEELMSFVLIGFGAGLQGEEIPLVSSRGL